MKVSHSHSKQAPMHPSARHLTLDVDGAFKLANPLVSSQDDSYTVFEKRGSSASRASSKDWCRRMPYAHCERRTPFAGRN